jgi:hypothetical protein
MSANISNVSIRAFSTILEGFLGTRHVLCRCPPTRIICVRTYVITALSYRASHSFARGLRTNARCTVRYGHIRTRVRVLYGSGTCTIPRTAPYLPSIMVRYARMDAFETFTDVSTSGPITLADS